MVTIFTYLDYRKFLKDSFDAMKASRPTFSHRSFARMAGFSASNFILLIIQGKRNLSSDGILKVAGALKLKKKEAEFFENLVRFDQGKTDAEKNFYYGRIAATRKYAEARPLEKEQYEYYSKWYIPAVREMIVIDGFREDPKWISLHIFPRITQAEAAEAIDVLMRIGLIERDPSGRLVQKERHISGGDEVASLAMKNFQRRMIELAARSVDETPPSKREIASVTFPVSSERLAEAKKMIREFRSRLAGFLAEDDGANAVYQFNMQLFNLSDVKGDEDEKVS